MKIKIIVVDIEMPAKIKKWALRLGIPAAALLVGSGLAWAAPAASLTLKTWATNDPLTAADLNGNFQNLQAQITPSTFGTRVPSAAHAGITGNVTVTAAKPVVVFNSKKFDLNGELDTTKGTITVQNAGVYLLDCQLSFHNPDDSYDYGAELIKTSSGGTLTQLVGSNSSSYGIGNNYFSTQVITTQQLDAGDAVGCQFYTNNTTIPAIVPGNDHDQTHLAVTRLY
jgi:hypothetical protein